MNYFEFYFLYVLIYHIHVNICIFFFKNPFECEVWRLFNKVYYFNVSRVVIAIEYPPKNQKMNFCGKKNEEFTPECQTSWNRYRGPTSRSEFSHHARRWGVVMRPRDKTSSQRPPIRILLSSQSVSLMCSAGIFRRCLRELRICFRPPRSISQDAWTSSPTSVPSSKIYTEVSAGYDLETEICCQVCSPESTERHCALWCE